MYTKTFQNKMRKLQSYYNRLAKGKKFKANHPNFDSFLAKHTIKQVGQKEEKTVIRTSTITKSIWE